MLSVEGAVPLVAETVSQLPLSAVVGIAVHCNWPVPSLRIEIVCVAGLPADGRATVETAGDVVEKGGVGLGDGQSDRNGQRSGGSRRVVRCGNNLSRVGAAAIQDVAAGSTLMVKHCGDDVLPVGVTCSQLSPFVEVEEITKSKAVLVNDVREEHLSERSISVERHGEANGINLLQSGDTDGDSDRNCNDLRAAFK